MNELFAILASAGIVFTAIYIIAKVFSINPAPKDDYWAGFIDGTIIGSDDCDD
jgi:hypothetical protein